MIKRIISRSALLLLIISLTLTSCGEVEVDKNGKSNLIVSEAVNIDSPDLCNIANDSPYAYILTYGKDSFHFLPEEELNVYFNINGKYNAISYSYVEDGINVISSSLFDNGRKIDLVLECEPDLLECHVAFEIMLSDSTVLNSDIYIVNTSYGAFMASTLSSARRRYLGFAKREGIMTESEYGRIITLLSEDVYVDYTGDFRAQIGYYGVDHSKTIIWISIMATIIAIIIILAVVMFVRRKKRKNYDGA